MNLQSSVSIWIKTQEPQEIFQKHQANMALTHSDNAPACISGGSETDDSFEAKLIAVRCRSTANKDFQQCDPTTRCSSPSAIPAPKKWRRNSRKQHKDAMSTSTLKSEILEQFDMSEVHHITVPCLNSDQMTTESPPCEMDEWAKDFLSLVE